MGKKNQKRSHHPLRAVAIPPKMIISCHTLHSSSTFPSAPMTPAQHISIFSLCRPISVVVPVPPTDAQQVTLSASPTPSPPPPSPMVDAEIAAAAGAPLRARTSAMRRPSFPSPRTAAMASAGASPCSTIRQAAARGSANTAAASLTLSGTCGPVCAAVRHEREQTRTHRTQRTKAVRTCMSNQGFVACRRKKARTRDFFWAFARTCMSPVVRLHLQQYVSKKKEGGKHICRGLYNLVHLAWQASL